MPMSSTFNLWGMGEDEGFHVSRGYQGPRVFYVSIASKGHKGSAATAPG